MGISEQFPMIGSATPMNEEPKEEPPSAASHWLGRSSPAPRVPLSFAHPVDFRSGEGLAGGILLSSGKMVSLEALGWFWRVLLVVAPKEEEQYFVSEDG